MSSKGRWSPTRSLVERIYWDRTLPRALRESNWYPNRPTIDQQVAAADKALLRAWAIARRYQRMCKRRDLRQRKMIGH